jgi:hypothetical protein
MSIDFSLDNVGPIDEEDLTSNQRIVKYSESWWAQRPHMKRCVAHRRNGKQCKHAAMNGTSVCQTHGGRAPQVKMRAKQRLEEATEKNARFLLEMCADTLIPEGVRLAAIRDALDRGGLGVKSSMEIEVSAKPFERVFDRITSGASPQELPALTEHGEDEEEPGSLKARLALRAQRNEYSDIED